ncbi:Panacea domain-containing protein [Leptospira dzoumogneensis]|nr:Panacea domain-containing protein [Leptospira dzoumogneensis]
MEIIRLIKMLYFADREALKEYNFPITGDSFASLPYGPIVSKTYNNIKKNVELPSLFNDYLIREDRWIQLKKEKAIKKLSEAEIEILDEVFHKYIHYTVAQLIDYCHNSSLVPEWRDPGSSSIPIDIEDLLVFLNKTQDEIKSIKESLKEHNEITSFLSKYEP